jgi:glycosyltransferase involved in cell wall biosynthesis
VKILLLGGSNSRNSGGVYTSALALGLNLKTHPDIDVQFLMYNDEYTIHDIDNYRDLKMNVYRILGPKSLAFSLDMYSVLCRIQPDIVHTQSLWMYLSRVNKKYHFNTGTPYVISIHGMLDKWQLHQSLWKDIKKKIVLSLYERKHLDQAACIIALCKEEYNAIRSFGLTNPVAIIPNGTNLPAIGERKRNNFPPRWKHRDNFKTLLFLSRIHPKKGLEILLKAWTLTASEQQKWQLVIAGETTDKEYMQSLIDFTIFNEIGNSVQFIGGQFGSDKELCFLNADAFILPSFSEGLPIAVLEAWSYKLPVIMTQFCNLQDGFSYNAAIPVDTTPQSISEGIMQLIRLDEKQISLMGLNGFNLVHERFTWEKVANSTLQLYSWLLNKRDKPEFVIET